MLVNPLLVVDDDTLHGSLIQLFDMYAEHTDYRLKHFSASLENTHYWKMECRFPGYISDALAEEDWRWNALNNPDFGKVSDEFSWTS